MEKTVENFASIFVPIFKNLANIREYFSGLCKTSTKGLKKNFLSGKKINFRYFYIVFSEDFLEKYVFEAIL